jgi:hypothetical protein
MSLSGWEQVDELILELTVVFLEDERIMPVDHLENAHRENVAIYTQ